MVDTKLTVNTEDLPTGILSSTNIARDIVFHSQNNTEIIRLDKEGMIFMGERIKDAGQAYEAWMKTMAIMQGKTATISKHDYISNEAYDCMGREALP